MFAHGLADATAIPIPHLLLPHLNPDWFYLSGTGLPSLSWKRGRLSDVVVVVVSQQVVTGILPQEFYHSLTALINCSVG